MALREVLRNACLRNSQGLVWPKNIQKVDGLDETREFLVLRVGCTLFPCLRGVRKPLEFCLCVFKPLVVLGRKRLATRANRTSIAHDYIQGVFKNYVRNFGWAFVL